MESKTYSFNMEDNKPTFSTAAETTTSAKASEMFTPGEGRSMSTPAESVFPENRHMSSAAETMFYENRRINSAAESMFSENRNIGNAAESMFHENRNIGNASESMFPENRNIGNASESMFPENRNIGNAAESMFPENRNIGNAPESMFPENRNIGNAPESMFPENRNIGNAPESVMSNRSESMFSVHAPAFQARGGNELFTLRSQMEPRAADTAPSTAEMDNLMNFRVSGSDHLYNLPEQASSSGSVHNFYTGNAGSSRAESVASSLGTLWSEGASVAPQGVPAYRNAEMVDTFEFLLKSLSSANNYVSMLTREQLLVLQAIRPAVLYDFLQEVAKVRGDRRMRRALPNECAFCKNNGENEESYGSHALKDWRGRVLCPVLRAFRCPRCGATAERAHTIKYCPENEAERAGLPRRRGPVPAGPRAPAAAPPPSPAPSQTSLWGFGIN